MDSRPSAALCFASLNLPSADRAYGGNAYGFSTLADGAQKEIDVSALVDEGTKSVDDTDDGDGDSVHDDDVDDDGSSSDSDSDSEDSSAPVRTVLAEFTHGNPACEE